MAGSTEPLNRERERTIEIERVLITQTLRPSTGNPAEPILSVKSSQKKRRSDII